MVISFRPAASLVSLRRPVLGRWALTVASAVAFAALAGCAGEPRFADGLDDPLGPQLTEGSLRDWRPPDASVFETHTHAHEPAPQAAPAPVPTKDVAFAGGQIRIPTSWTVQGRARPWRWVVVHHSATPDGGAAAFDRLHRGNGWDELGYHFVIGNGTDTPDGYVEVGPRWRKQKHGAHAKTEDNRYNELGVGICLVGDFTGRPPTAKQLQSLAVLTAYLMDQHDIPASRVIGHGDTKPTACPGRYLYAQLPAVRKVATNVVAQGALHGRPRLASHKSAQGGGAGETR